MNFKKKIRLLTIIVNYKTPELVCNALDSLENEIDYAIDQVVVVDNFSNDDSVEIIFKYINRKSWQDWVEVICSPINAGFSAGNNIGIRYIDADYYLLLNSDAWVRPRAIALMVKKMMDNPRIGLVSPRLEWADGRQQTSCFYHFTPLNCFANSAKTGVISRISKYVGLNEIAIPLTQHKEVKPQWVSFACVLLKGDMVKEIGLMDEGFFMYFEDSDYCRRAELAEWPKEHEPEAKVVHLNLGSSNQSSLKRLPVYYFISRSRYFLKYYGRRGLFFANLLWLFGRCISWLRELLEKKPKSFHSLMWLDIWFGFWVRVDKHGK